MNRIKHKGFPSSIYEVVFQQGQFAPIDDGGYKKAKPTEKVKLSVKKSFIVDYSKGALYFRTVKGATPDCWHERNLTRLFDHGGHRFYK
jgi:spore germination cell wall hydrolase CwlJ-like protein